MSEPAKVIHLPVGRQWESAKISSIENAWNVYSRPADVDIRYGISLIRARARELAQNADHAKGFLRIVRNNVVGATGFTLQSRAVRANGKPDVQIRNAVEKEWREWGKRGNCDVSGKFSWKSLQRHAIETVARDGEAFIRILPRWDNRWSFALQVIDPEAVDPSYDGEYEGREIRMGVEIDAFRRPVAYWVIPEQRLSHSSYRVGDRYRIPASEMLHLYLPEFCWQTRGVSWLAISAGRLHMVQGTEDAEVTASRASAAKFAAYEAQEWAPPPEPSSSNILGPDGKPISTDPGSFAQDIAPGSMEVVPWGYKLNMLDPSHPNAAMPDFLKWALRSLSTGWGVSYNTIGNDAEGVNYTSLRFFLGVERDNWMETQDWFEDELPNPVFNQWIGNQIGLGNIATRPNQRDQARSIKWQPRRWEGPDPTKQAQADEIELRNGTTTLTEITARKGRDLEDMVAQRIQEIVMIKDAAEDAGLSLTDVLPSVMASATTAQAHQDEEVTDNADD